MFFVARFSFLVRTRIYLIPAMRSEANENEPGMGVDLVEMKRNFGIVGIFI